MTDPKKEAREALTETRESAVVTSKVADEASRVFEQIRHHRLENHYTDKLLSIMRGSP